MLLTLLAALFCFIDRNCLTIGNAWGMEWERYDIEEGRDGLSYEFCSEGPKGWIRKTVKFQHRPEVGPNVYNLVLSDFEERTDLADDSAVSNNGDYKKVLLSVAEIAEKFLNLHPRAIISIRGLTASRSRLFQMGISSAWLEISERYDIWGRQANKWSSFEKGVNYEEFLVFKKIP